MLPKVVYFVASSSPGDEISNSLFCASSYSLLMSAVDGKGEPPGGRQRWHD